MHSLRLDPSTATVPLRHRWDQGVLGENNNKRLGAFATMLLRYRLAPTQHEQERTELSLSSPPLFLFFFSSFFFLSLFFSLSYFFLQQVIPHQCLHALFPISSLYRLAHLWAPTRQRQCFYAIAGQRRVETETRPATMLLRYRFGRSRGLFFFLIMSWVLGCGFLRGETNSMHLRSIGEDTKRMGVGTDGSLEILPLYLLIMSSTR